jgi:hypothetical protein
VVRRRLVILTAITLEARAVAGAWGLPVPKPGKPVRTDSVVPSIEIHLVGIRAHRLPANLTDPPISGILMAGLAGALDPSLIAGDVIIDDCPPAWLPATPFRTGKIIVSPTIVSTPGDKRRLFERTNALAVDMESAATRTLAAKLNVPFVSIRAISDTAAESLDPAVLSMVDEFGNPRPLSIAAALIRRPSLVPRLKQLGANSKLAAANLAAAITSIVRRIIETELAASPETSDSGK